MIDMCAPQALLRLLQAAAGVAGELVACQGGAA